MQKTCAITGKPFTITDCEAAFLKESDLPLPMLHPEERFRQLMATRNEWKLYHRTCDATGDAILSAYPADSLYTVYRNDVWWGDSWEALDYGRDFDFSRPFFQQFFELQRAVPREGTTIFDSENCDYNSHTRYSKNCYLNSLVVRAEDLHYSYWMVDVENCIDCCLHISGKSALCYECVDFSTCYNCIALQEGYNCNDCHFSYQLRGCDHCIFCSNLTKKSYHIRNHPCSKEEYETLLRKLLNGSHASFQEGYNTFLETRQNAVHRATTQINCENVVGDHIFDSKNIAGCFDGDHSEDCSNSASINDSKDIHSCYSAGWPRCEKLYNCAVSRGCIDMAFCRYMWFSNDMRYCDSCQTCKHCIGCTGLRHKDYCILNKQYTKAEYEELAPRVIAHMKKTGEWGSFWPYETLPYAYNESAAADYFPLTEKEAVQRGFLWRTMEDDIPDTKKMIEAKDVPDALNDAPDDLLSIAIRCEATGKPYRLIKQELDFYKRMQLPLPRIHPTERQRKRMALRNPYMLFTRKCNTCGNAIPSTYAPERKEAVMCGECYLKEVY